MAIKIQLRRGTAAQWTTENPLLADGEQGFEKDTGRRKVGDGITLWNNLPYAADGSQAVSDHVSDADPHTQYLTENKHDNLPNDNPHGVTAAQVGADPAGTAATESAAAVAAHEALGDPHSQYETTAEVNAKITAHENAADPHSQYTSNAEAQALVDNHANDQTNPHAVTAAQVGTLTTAQINTAISTAINNLINGAPGALDTLNELAQAISANDGDISNLLNQIAQVASDLSDHEGDFTNPHQVTKAQVGLGNVNNTSDANKPVSGPQQTALNLKANQTALVSEANARASADTTLQNNIDAESSARNSADQNLQGQITSNDNELSAFATEQNTQNQNISNNSTAISQETTARQNADTTLQNNIDGKVDEIPGPAADGDYIRRVVGGVRSWVVQTVTGGGQWLTNTLGIHYSSGNVGIRTDNPQHTLQLGEKFNDTQANNAVDQLREIKVYAGQNTNDGLARIALLESVPQAFPGDYGVYQQYNAATNLFEIVTVQGGVESVAFTFSRATQVAAFFAQMNLNNNQIVNVANPTTAQGVVTAILRDSIKVRNSSPIANVNTGPTAITGLNIIPEMPAQYGQFTVQTNGITPQFTGFAKLTFTCHFTGSATRAAPGFRWITGALVGPQNSETYIRNTNGHNESTGKISAIVPCTSGQIIQVQHNNLAAAGTLAVAVNDIEFSLERIR